MEQQHIVIKKEEVVEPEHNGFPEKVISLRKRKLSDEVMVKELEDGIYKKRKYEFGIENWNSLSWTCYHCHSTLESFKALKKHSETMHELTSILDDTYQCSDCNQFSISYPTFINHVRTAHHDALKLCCDVCNEILPDYAQLSLHREVHNEILGNAYPIVHHCSLCGSAAATEKELKNHIQLAHSSISSEEIRIKEEVFSNTAEESTKISQLPLCKEETECDLYSIQYKEEYNDTGQIYQCGSCVKSFASEIDLEHHAQIHDKNLKHVCEFCPKVFQYKSRLEAHMHSHAAELPFQCETCSKRYSKKTELTDHMRLHNVKLPHKCFYCEQRFSLEERKIEHMLTHTGARPFKCDVCSNSFMEKHQLTAHLRMHSEIRPFQCDLCEKSFKSNWAVKSHVRNIHSDDQPYNCEMCLRSFKNLSNMKKHAKICKGTT